MSGVPDYRRATNKAYELLLSMPSFSLTLDVFAAVKLMPDCVVISYRKAVEEYGIDPELLASNSDYGFTFLEPKTNRRIILYNDTLPVDCIRFTIAHELGHYILEHLLRIRSPQKPQRKKQIVLPETYSALPRSLKNWLLPQQKNTNPCFMLVQKWLVSLSSTER